MVKTANGKQIRAWTFDIPLRSLVKLIYLTSALKNKNQKLRKHSLHARTGLYLQIYPYLFFIDKTFYGYVARLTDLVIKRYLTFSHAQPAIDVLLKEVSTHTRRSHRLTRPFLVVPNRKITVKWHALITGKRDRKIRPPWSHSLSAADGQRFWLLEQPHQQQNFRVT